MRMTMGIAEATRRLLDWLRQGLDEPDDAIEARGSELPDARSDAVEWPWRYRWDHLPKRSAGFGFSGRDYDAARARAEEIAPHPRRRPLDARPARRLRRSPLGSLPRRHLSPANRTPHRGPLRPWSPASVAAAVPLHQPDLPLTEAEFFAHLYLYARDNEDELIRVARNLGPAARTHLLNRALPISEPVIGDGKIAGADTSQSQSSRPDGRGLTLRFHHANRNDGRRLVAEARPVAGRAAVVQRAAALGLGAPLGAAALMHQRQVAAGAAQNATPVAAPSGEPITIGAAVSTTGSNGRTGLYQQEAYLLWEEQKNAAGGLLGQPVRMVLYDDQSDPATGARLYERLLTEDQVDLVLGPYSSSVTQAVAQVTERAGQPLLAAGAPPATSGRGYRTFSASTR